MNTEREKLVEKLEKAKREYAETGRTLDKTKRDLSKARRAIDKVYRTHAKADGAGDELAKAVLTYSQVHCDTIFLAYSRDKAYRDYTEAIRARGESDHDFVKGDRALDKARRAIDKTLCADTKARGAYNKAKHNLRTQTKG